MEKIVFLDIDGTLRSDEGTISLEVVETINKLIDKGIEVVLCSGRPRYHVEKLNDIVAKCRYIITSNGAEIYDLKNKKNVRNMAIPYEDLVYLTELAISNNTKFVMCLGDKEYANRNLRNDNQILIDNNMEEIIKGNEIKSFLIMEITIEQANKLMEEVNKQERIFVVEHNFKNVIYGPYFSVTKRETSKGNSVEYLCKLLGIDLGDAVAIGNDTNDVSMFSVVGLSVAMDNASEEIKNRVDMITLSNNDDGVNHILKEIFKEIL